MIERDIIKKSLKEFHIKEYMADVVGKSGYSHTEIQRTPLGEKVIVYSSKPGLVVGSKGKGIKELTEVLKNKFGLENPQVEVSEVDRPFLNPKSVSKEIVSSFERFGPRRFKFTGYKMLESIMSAGAQGAEIVITGRGIPSTRSKCWRFSAGHLKKSGDISENFVSRGYSIAHLKSGAVGVKVSILTPDVKLPDTINLKEVVVEEKEAEEVKEETSEDKKEQPNVEKKGESKKEEPKTEKKEEAKLEKKEVKKAEPKKEEKIPTASELKKIKEEKDVNNKKE
jgi:small subunit ribosomal protein S3